MGTYSSRNTEGTVSLWARLDCFAQLNTGKCLVVSQLHRPALLMRRRGLPLSERIPRRGGLKGKQKGKGRRLEEVGREEGGEAVIRI